MPKVGGRRKKHRTHKEIDEEEEENIPKSFVFRKGKASPELKEAVLDMRKCMYPNTAMNLQDSANLKLSSFVRAAKYYKVSHLMAFHTKGNKNFVRFIKMNGPVLTFRIVNFCRARDIINNVRQSQPFLREINAPLLVLNNFSNKGGDVRRISQMIQGMFPALNMSKVKPQHLKRVVSFTYNQENGCVYFRNYRVKLATTGASKSIQEILEKKTIDFSGFRNFSEYMEAQGESESKQGKMKQTVKLYEVGPRMKLRFFRYDEVLNIKQIPQEEEGQEQEVYGQQNQKHFQGMQEQAEIKGEGDEGEGMVDQD